MRRLNTNKESGAGSTLATGGRINRKSGRETEAKIELSDTYPVSIKVIANTMRHRGKAKGKSAMSIPATVPTPLPPLKPEKTVYVCPNTAAKPQRI